MSTNNLRKAKKKIQRLEALVERLYSERDKYAERVQRFNEENTRLSEVEREAEASW